MKIRSRHSFPNSCLKYVKDCERLMNVELVQSREILKTKVLKAVVFLGGMSTWRWIISSLHSRNVCLLVNLRPKESQPSLYSDLVHTLRWLKKTFPWCKRSVLAPRSKVTKATKAWFYKLRNINTKILLLQRR